MKEIFRKKLNQYISRYRLGWKIGATIPCVTVFQTPNESWYAYIVQYRLCTVHAHRFHVETWNTVPHVQYFLNEWKNLLVWPTFPFYQKLHFSLRRKKYNINKYIWEHFNYRKITHSLCSCCEVWYIHRLPRLEYLRSQLSIRKSSQKPTDMIL